MRASNKWIFQELAKSLPKDEVFPLDTGKYIITNDDEKNWLKHIKINSANTIYFENGKCASIASYNDTSYLICVGLNEEIKTSDISIIPTNSGIYSATISTLEIKPLNDPNTGDRLIENGIFIPTRLNITEKEDFQKEEIEPFFPRVSTYIIPTESPLSRGELLHHRIGVYLLTELKELRHLSWPDEHLQIIKSITTLPTENYPLELLIRCLQETKWHYAFLDVYRSIEFLFPLRKAKQLKERVGYSESEIDLSSIIEQVLGWRPTEISALEAILSNIGSQVITELNKLFLPYDAQQKDAPRAAAKRIYDCRNSTVHFRPAHSRNHQSNPTCWTSLTKVMLSISLEAYQQHFECINVEN